MSRGGNRDESMSVIVPEAALVRLILAHRRASVELAKLEAMGIAIDNDRLIPDLTPHLLDMLGCPHDSEAESGLWDGLGIDMEGVEDEASAKEWLFDARQKIAAYWRGQ